MVIPGQKILRAMFGVDLRSVALLRIGLAVMLLADLAVNAKQLRIFYTDEGVLPRDLLAAYPPFPSHWSLHLWGGSFSFEAALFSVQAGLALCLLVGYRTRFAVIASYGLLLSMEARNPIVLYGADLSLRLGLFWAMFLPLADRASLDAALGRIRPARENSWLNLAGFAYLLQLVMAYACSALQKTGPTWVTTHTAVSYALSLDIYSRPLGQWLKQFDGLTHGLTIGVRYLELYGPLLFILPWWNRWARLLGFGLFAGLQLGFGLCMQLSLFGPIMVVITFILLPAEFWTGVAAPAGQWLATAPPLAGILAWWRHRLKRWRRAVPVPPADQGQGPEVRRALGWVRHGVVLAAVVLMTGWNLQQLPGQKQLVPTSLNWIAWDTGLDEVFYLFAPDPDNSDGWFVLRGTMEDGRTVNVLTGASPADFAKPADVPASYGGDRMMSYLLTLGSPGGEPYLEPFALYFGREWNRTHPAADQLISLEIIYLSEPTLPNFTKPPVEEEHLWIETF